MLFVFLLNSHMKESQESPPDLSKKIRATEVGFKVGSLIQFASLLIPDIDLFEEVLEHSAKNLSFVRNGAAVIEALGKDPETIDFFAQLYSKRARALLELVKVLKETEEDRAKLESKGKVVADALKALGL